ncbi:MAG TPA: hypothetical protein VES20_08740, partial [Bryobacteraceae bacterium]|nr:hypothetical protein [Bryobacteraceae bacterium]
DEANWLLGDSYARMGPRFRQRAGAAYARIVREYPLSSFADSAKKRLVEMEMPVPEADPVAYNRMKYEIENRNKPSMSDAAFGIFKRGPSVKAAAKSGTPAMESLRPTIPVSVPVPGDAAGGFQGDVAVQQVGSGNTALDTQPDARSGRAADGTAPQTGAAPGADAGAAPAAAAPAAATPAAEGQASGAATAPEAGQAKQNNKKKQKKEKEKK